MNTPTPEAIEAAENALDMHGEYSTNDQLAVIAVTAAAPLIAAQAKAEALAEVADKHEREIGDLIDERDAMHEWADRLAYAIAPMEVIGEHSSGNNPWENALDYLPATIESES